MILVDVVVYNKSLSHILMKYNREYGFDFIDGKMPPEKEELGVVEVGYSTLQDVGIPREDIELKFLRHEGVITTDGQWEKVLPYRGIK